MTRRSVPGPPQTSGGWRPGMVGVWSVRVRHVLWLLLLWMVCGLHLLYLFASYGAQTPTSTLQQQAQEEEDLQVATGGGVVRSAGTNNGVGSSSRNAQPADRGQILNSPSQVNVIAPGEVGGGGVEVRPLGARLQTHWGLEQGEMEESLRPLRLEGQQLRHLAHIDGLVSSRNQEKPHTSENNPIKITPISKSTRSYMDKIHNPQEGKTDNPQNLKVTGGIDDDIQHKINLRSLLPNIADINNNSTTGTGSADPLTSIKPDTWTACASLTPPEIQQLPLEDAEGQNEESESSSEAGGQINEAGWQVVRPGQSYVFSAYHDPRPLVLGGKARHGVVRVIGMTDTRVDGAPQFCQLWYAPPEAHPPTPGRRRRRVEGGSTGQGGKEKQQQPRRNRRNTRGQYDRRSQSHQHGAANETQPSPPWSARPGGGSAHPRGGSAHRGGGNPHPRKGGEWMDTGGKRRGPQRPWPVVVPAISDIVPETHGLRFAPFIYTCRLTSEVLPVAVSMVHSRCDTPLNYLKIQATPNLQDSSSGSALNYTVCVTPFNFNYNSVNQLVEKIEVDRVFGSNRFIFYNHSSGPDLGRYLRSYIDDGIVDVVQWRLPVHVDTWPPSAQEVDVHYFGQLAALNDCLYRSMFHSQMVVFTDMDEFIVPKRHKDWRDMVAFLHHKGQGTAATYVFQNAFFRTEWGDDTGSLSSSERDAMNSYRIMSLSKTKRERYIYPWGMRSKFICDPLKVEMVGVHNIWRFVNDSFTELDVPADIGLLHHYRSWNKPQEENSVLDRSMHTYHDVIISRVRERHEKVRDMYSREKLREMRPSLQRFHRGPAYR